MSTDVSEEHIAPIFGLGSVACFNPGFLLGVLFNPEDGGDIMFIRKVSGLHGVISQKTEDLIITAVRT
jgi:hypothetical protein